MKNSAEAVTMDLNKMTVPEVTELVGSMQTNYRLENRGFISIKVDAEPRMSTVSISPVAAKTSRTLASMVQCR